MNKAIKKACMLSVLVFCGFTVAQAQPTSAAPTPPHDEADVVSLFSDHYKTTGKGPEPQTYGGDAAVTTTTIAGTEDKLLTTTGNGNCIFTSGWTAQKKGTIRMDVYPEQNTTFSFGIGTTFGNSQTWLKGYTWPTLKAGEWNTIEVPVVEFVKAGLDDASNIQSIRFQSKGKYYVDNIYAYGEKETYVAPVEIPIAPTPTHDETKNLVKSAFSDSYQRAIKEDPFTVAYAGKISTIKRVYKDDETQHVLELKNLSTGGVNVSTWDLTKCSHIHIDVYWDGSGDGTFEFGMNKDDWSGKKFSYMENFAWPKLVANQWVGIDIPLGEFASFFQLKIIMIQFKGSGTFYVDNFYGYFEEQAPLTEPITVPTVKGVEKENVMSLFCEQFDNPTDTLTIKDTDANGDLMWYGGNKNLTREFVEIVPDNQTIFLTEWTDYPFKMHTEGKSVDISDMEYIHASAYLMSPLDATNKPLTVKFMLHDRDDKRASTSSVTLKPGQWVSFSIPLCHFKDIDMTRAYVMRLQAGGYPGMKVYLDNIILYKGEPAEGTVMAPDCTELPPVDPPCTEKIQNKEAGELPPVTRPYLGVNLSSASGGTVPGTLDTNYAMPKMEDLYYFNAKGVKLFRFPFRWRRVQDELFGPLDLEVDIAAMKKVVTEAERLGMWVMLDMHDYAERTIKHDKALGHDGKMMQDTVFQLDGRYKTWKIEGDPDSGYGNWKVADDPGEFDLRDAFVDVWVKLANEFKGFKNIWGYDLQNEPKGVDLEGLRECYQRVIDEVRKVDPRTAIVVEGKNYSGAEGWYNNAKGLETLTDPSNNIIYEAHTYFDNDNSGTYDSSYDNEIKDFNIYKKRLDPFIKWLKEHNKRGMLGEFGVPYNGAKNSDPRYMELIDSVFLYLKQNQLTATIWCGGFFYESNHLSVSPDKDYCTEKSTMAVMEKYIENFHEDEEDPNAVKGIKVDNTAVSTYPNPVVNTLTINAKHSISSVRIYNIFGQMLREETVNAIQGTIDFSEYTNGNYILQVEQADGTASVLRITKK